jgi:glutathione S-transferase
MTAVPATLLSAIVTILAVLLYFYMGLVVAQMRTKHNLPAPAMSGNPEFERAWRVHYNTLEQIVIFLPLLWLATIYFHVIGWVAPALGLLWLIGRVVYMQGYLAAAEKRSMGFMIGSIATLGLLILSVWGIVVAWSAAMM